MCRSWKEKKKDARERVKKKEKRTPGERGSTQNHSTQKKKKILFFPWTLVIKHCHMGGACDKGTEISFALLKSKRRKFRKSIDKN